MTPTARRTDAREDPSFGAASRRRLPPLVGDVGGRRGPRPAVGGCGSRRAGLGGGGVHLAGTELTDT